ncbi:hypothetical protein ACJIZ3_011763 [Penstemon smallii]|uniref:Uncharacterized protein n=1 Tax=Penstemon smallii TaxID=265156 RepID=A0ABD3ULP4_9LAMI
MLVDLMILFYQDFTHNSAFCDIMCKNFHKHLRSYSGHTNDIWYIYAFLSLKSTCCLGELSISKQH